MPITPTAPDPTMPTGATSSWKCYGRSNGGECEYRVGGDGDATCGFVADGEVVAVATCGLLADGDLEFNAPYGFVAASFHLSTLTTHDMVATRAA
jgi:hypothetical protein